jgi:hypothetical protein
MSGRGLTSIELAAAGASATVVSQLIEVMFDSGPLRLAMGAIEITDPNTGTVWYATGRALAIGDGRESVGSLEGFNFTLSGLDPVIVTLAASEPYQGRIIRVYEAWLDEAWQLVAPPRVEWVGRLSALSIEEQDRKCTVSGSAEHYEADLRRARSQRYTAADQRRKFPGDLGCDLLESMVDAVVVWPNKDIQKHEGG